MTAGTVATGNHRVGAACAASWAADMPVSVALFFGFPMRAVTIPVWQALASLPPVLALEGEVQADSRLALVSLWSWVAEHGDGPHSSPTVERAIGWTGLPGLLSSALVATGWAMQGDDGRLTVRRWQDVVGSSADESPAERRRRQTREAMRRHREKKVPNLHSQLREQPVSIGEQDVSKCEQLVSIGEQNVSFGEQSVSKCEQDVSKCEQEPAPVSTLSLFSVFQNQKKKNPEEELEHVGLNPAPLAPAGLTASVSRSAADALSAAIEARLAFDPGADLTDLLFLDLTEERPAVALQSTIEPLVRSVPVQAPDRAPEADSGRPTAKRSRSKKTTVDLERVDPAVRAVWTAYADAVGSRVVLSAARADLIAARLADGWTVDELSTACRGYGFSPFHNGDNDRKQLYKTIELWLRDAAHVEQGIAFAKSPPTTKNAPKRAESIEEKHRLLAEKYGVTDGVINDTSWDV